MKTLRINSKLLFLPILLCFMWACSDSSVGPEPPQPPGASGLEKVAIVGTQVETKSFYQTGDFTVLAVPVSANGKSNLSSSIQADIKLNSVSFISGSQTVTRARSGKSSGNGTLDIAAQVISNSINKPSNNQPLAVAMDIDGSASMKITDPDRLRVDAAKDFINKFGQSSIPNGWSISIFTYRGNPNSSFQYSELLTPFTDDVQALKNAAEQVKENSTTPTYKSLLEVLNYSEDKKPHQSNNRAIVLLSDGIPNVAIRHIGPGAPSDSSFRREACRKASQMDTPIYAIGLGPASGFWKRDSSYPSSDSAKMRSAKISAIAIAEMRYIASCSGGSYAGVVPKGQSITTTPSTKKNTSQEASLSDIFKSIAVATIQGNMKFKVHLSGPGVETLASKEAILNFTLTLTTPNGTKSRDFSFKTYPSDVWK